MKYVRIVDYFSVYTFHEVINYLLIQICSNLFERVTYVSGKTAQKNMKRLVMQRGKAMDNVRYEAMPTYNADTPWGARIRDVWGVFVTIYQYIITPYSTLLFYNYVNKLSLPIILSLNIVLRKKIIFVFHGELEFLISKVSYVKTSGWYKKCMQWSFRYLFGKSPAYVMVLGDSIKSNLLKLYPNLSGRVLSICHPYLLTDVTAPVKYDKQVGHVVRIGTVGTMKESKGLKEYIELASSLKDLLDEEKLELYSVGRVYSGTIQLPKDIHWIGWKEGLPREEFDVQIEKLDYLLYLYPVDSYKFTASGAILDAVKLRKPIIALHNDYFDYLIGNCPIGYMGHCIKDLEQVIRQVVNRELCDDFKNGFKALERKVDVESNTEVFKKELEKLGWL